MILGYERISRIFQFEWFFMNIINGRLVIDIGVNKESHIGSFYTSQTS